MSNPDPLRMIRDKAEFNEFVKSPRFSVKGLNIARHIIRDGDILMFNNESDIFWQAE